MTKDADLTKIAINPAMQEALKQIQQNNGLVQKANELHPSNFASKVFETRVPTFSERLGDGRSKFTEIQEAMIQEKARKEREDAEYKQAVMKSLQGIEKNTATLTEMTLLLQKSGERQDEIFAIMVEILEIMKSSNTEEAKSRFTKVMEKITGFKDNAETMISLYGMAHSVYNAYEALPPIAHIKP